MGNQEEITFAGLSQSTRMFRQSDTQGINTTLTSKLVWAVFVCVPPPDKLFVTRLVGPRALVAGISQTLSVQDGEHNHRPPQRTGPPPFDI